MNQSIPAWRATPLFCVLVLSGCGSCNRPAKPPQAARLTSQQIGENTELFRQEIEKRIVDNDYSAAVKFVSQVDIQALVESSVAAQDFRWMAVYEDGLEFPGLADSLWINAKPIDYWILPGTQDAIEDIQWQATATKFAAQYNQLLRDHPETQAYVDSLREHP